MAWRCGVCETWNEAGTHACVVCDERRPRSALPQRSLGERLAPRAALAVLRLHGARLHPDGYFFIAVSAFVAALPWLFASRLALPALFLTGLAAFAFRDPLRRTPVRDGLVVAPADGEITAIRRRPAPEAPGWERETVLCVSIRVSALDVYVIRAPVAGGVAYCAPYADGDSRCLVAFRAGAGGGRVALAVTARGGLQRIVAMAPERTMALPGSRIGMIRFGGEVEVYIRTPHGLPADGLLAGVGQRTVAGETALADLMSEEGERRFRRERTRR